MTLSSRHSGELSTSNRSPLSIFPSPRLCHASSSLLFLSHSLVAPFFPVRLPLCCQCRCHGLLIRFLFSFLSHFILTDAFCRQNVGRDVSWLGFVPDRLFDLGQLPSHFSHVSFQFIITIVSSPFLPNCATRSSFHSISGQSFSVFFLENEQWLFPKKLLKIAQTIKKYKRTMTPSHVLTFPPMILYGIGAYLCKDLLRICCNKMNKIQTFEIVDPFDGSMHLVDYFRTYSQSDITTISVSINNPYAWLSCSSSWCFSFGKQKKNSAAVLSSTDVVS